MGMPYSASDHWAYLNIELKSIQRFVKVLDPQGEQAIFAHNVQQYLKGRMNQLEAEV